MLKVKCNNILIVDDEIGPRESLRIILKDDYNLDFATSGREAMRKYPEGDTDLVILDIKMPDISGIEVLKKVKDVNPDIEVIMLTGFGTYDTAQAAVRYGAFDYIDKPFDVDKIRDVVRRAMLRRRLSLQSRKDLDELREINSELEEELLHMSKLAHAGKLSASAMHEIRNPLSAICGYVEILQGLLKKGVVLKEKDYEDSRNYLAIMEKAIDRCNKFIQNLLSYSRKPTKGIKETSVGAVVESLVSLIKPKAVSQNVTIKTEIDGEPLMVKCDPDELQHALMNIIFNALEAMPEGGELSIESYPLSNKTARDEARRLGLKGLPKAAHVAIVIADSGKGIPHEDFSRIFEPFFTRRKGADGTGLGLTFSQKVVEKYGGAIGVESSIGGGSRFYLFFPVDETQPPSRTESQ